MMDPESFRKVLMSDVDAAFSHPLFIASLSVERVRRLRALRRLWETASTALLRDYYALYNAEP